MIDFFKAPMPIEPAPVESRTGLIRHGGLALAAAAIVLAPFAARTYAQDEMGFDRPLLLAEANDAQRAVLESADRHILVVRHAFKTSPDCNAIDCQLSADGEAQVAVLAGLLGETPVDAAYSSAACRAADTAAAGGLWVTMHRAADTYALACGGGTVDRTRDQAMTEARDGLARWTIVGEHSNTTCLWVAAFAGDDASIEAGCVEGRLDHDAYGDVFWLHRVAGEWAVIVLPRAFDIDITVDDSAH